MESSSRLEHQISWISFSRLRARDGLVPPSKVRETFARTAHPASRMHELSIAHGHAADYGHVDLLLGRHAETEVFPLIERWLMTPITTAK